MRIPRSADLIALCGGLTMVLLAAGAFMASYNECAATEMAAHGLYRTFPGIDVDGIPGAAREALVAQLNERRCVCGCLMTIASCLNNHTSCRTSKRLGQGMAESAHRNSQPAGGKP